MVPQKFSSNLFLEYPPILGHYVESERNLWIEGNPRRARLTMLNRPGRFMDLEALAVERRHLVQILGAERAAMTLFRMGFESGRRDARRHMEQFGDNHRLAIQACLVYGQLQGRFIADLKLLEMDLGKNTLRRELVLDSSSEAAEHRMSLANTEGACCWRTNGYLSGHLSEIVGRRVLSVEETCAGCADADCRLISKFDSEWNDEADWMRTALAMECLGDEMERKEKLLASAQSAARAAQLKLNNLQRRVSPESLMQNVIPDTTRASELGKRVVQLSAVDTPVVIVGERGVGKETTARSIHQASARKNKPFVGVESSSLAGALGRQELFGYAPGAVAGSPQGYKGALFRAKGGSLYCSDIAALGLDVQAALARALNEGEVEPLGADVPLKIDARLIASMLGGLEDAYDEGRLHADLYYALRAGVVQIEPLRERPNDIARLAQHFLNEFRERHNRPALEMSNDFKHILVKSSWPGNVSQLRSVIEHAVLMSMGGELCPADLPDDILVNRARHNADELTSEVLRAALKRTRNNKTRAAELLGVGRTTLWRAMKKHGVASGQKAV